MSSKRLSTKEDLPDDVEPNDGIAVVAVHGDTESNQNEIPVYHLVEAKPEKNDGDTDADGSDEDGCLWNLARQILDHSEVLRKIALYTVLASLLPVFIVGVVIVILDEESFGNRWKALGTCGAVSVGAVVNLLLTIGLNYNQESESKAFVVASLAGMIVTPIAMLLGISLIWTLEKGDDDDDSEGVSKQVWKAIASFGLLAIGLAYISLTSFFRRAPRTLVWWARLFAQIEFFLIWLGFIAESTGGLVVVIALGVIVTVLSVAMFGTHMINRLQNIDPSANQTTENSDTAHGENDLKGTGGEDEQNGHNQGNFVLIEPRKIWRFLVQATPPLCILVAGLCLTLAEDSTWPTLATVGTIIATAVAIVVLSLGFEQGSGYNQRTIMSVLTLFAMFVATPVGFVSVLVLIWFSYFNDEDDSTETYGNGDVLRKVVTTVATVVVALAYASLLKRLTRAPKKLLRIAGALTYQALILLWLALIAETDGGLFILISFGLAAAFCTMGAFVHHSNAVQGSVSTQDANEEEIEELELKAKIQKLALLQLCCMPSALLLLAGILMTLLSTPHVYTWLTCATLLVGSVLIYVQTMGFHRGKASTVISILGAVVTTPSLIACTIGLIWRIRYEDTHPHEPHLKENLLKTSVTFGLLSIELAYTCFMSRFSHVPGPLAINNCSFAMVLFLIWLMVVKDTSDGFEFAVWMGVLAAIATLVELIEAKTTQSQDQEEQTGSQMPSRLLSVSYIEIPAMRSQADTLRKATLGLLCLSQLTIFCSGVAVIILEKRSVVAPLLWTCASLTGGSLCLLYFTFCIHRGPQLVQRAATLFSFMGIFCFVPAATVCAIGVAWERNERYHIADVPASWGKTGATFGLLSAAATYFATASIFHKANRKIRILADVAAFMLLFLVWLAVIMESDGGKVPMIILAVFLGLLSLFILRSHLQHRRRAEVNEHTTIEDDEPVTVVSKIIKNVRMGARMLFYLSPLLAIFVAGLLMTPELSHYDTVDETIATAVLIPIASLYVVILSLGLMNGEGRPSMILSFLSIAGMTILVPISLGLAIALVWKGGDYYYHEVSVWHYVIHGFGDGRSALVKWTASFSLVTTGIAYLCLLTALKGSRRLKLLVSTLAMQGLFLAWLAVMVRSNGSLVVLIIYAVVVVLLTFRVFANQDFAERNQRQEIENELVQRLMTSGEVEAIPLQKTVKIYSRYLLLNSPFLALFISGCITTFVEDCKWPVLQTCAIIVATFLYTAIQSLGVGEGSGWYKNAITVLSAFCMIVLTPTSAAISIALVWKYHNNARMTNSLTKTTATFAVLLTALSYLCLTAYLRFAPRKLRFLSTTTSFMALFLVWLGFIAESDGGKVALSILAVVGFLSTLLAFITDFEQRRQLDRREADEPGENVEDIEAQNEPSEQQSPKNMFTKATIQQTASYLLASSPVVGIFLCGVTATFKDDALGASLMTGIYYVLGCSCEFLLSLGYGRGPILTGISAFGMLITTPISYALVVSLIWGSPDPSQFGDLDTSSSLMKSCSTFGLVTVASAYTCLMSILTRPPTRLRALALLCSIMTIFLLWLGIIAESAEGLVVAIVLGIGSLALFCWLCHYQFFNENPISQDAEEEALEASLKEKVGKIAFFIFFCSPLAALFLAGILSTLKEDLWPSLATGGILLCGAGYFALLSFGFKPGEPGNYKSFLLLSSVLGMSVTPVATGLTMKLVWDLMYVGDAAGGLTKWTASLGLLATTTVYICLISLCKNAPEKLIILADLCSFMMFFFFWLSLIVENEEGLKVALSVGAFAVLLTVLVLLIHIRRGGFGYHCCRKRKEPAILPLAQAETVDEPVIHDEPAQTKTKEIESTATAFIGESTVATPPQDEKANQLVGAHKKQIGRLSPPVPSQVSKAVLEDEEVASKDAASKADGKVDMLERKERKSPEHGEQNGGCKTDTDFDVDRLIEARSEKQAEFVLDELDIDQPMEAKKETNANLAPNSLKTDKEVVLKVPAPEEVAPEEAVSPTVTASSVDEHHGILEGVIPETAGVPPAMIPSIGARVNTSVARKKKQRKRAFFVVFVNTGIDPAMKDAELYLNSMPFGPLGHQDPPLTVSTYPGHRWFIVVDDVYVKLFEIADGDEDRTIEI